MILISNDFWHKRKMYNFDPLNVLLAIIVQLMTAFVLQGHILTIGERYGVFVHVQFVLVCSRSVMMMMMLTWRADRLPGEGHVEGGLLAER